MAYQFDFTVVIENYGLLLRGALLTLRLSVFAMAGGMIIAVITVLARQSKLAPLRWLAISYIEAIRNTPFLVQLFFFFFGLPSVGIRMTPDAAAFLALSLNGGAYAAEIIRGGIAAVGPGQSEAGYALGLRRLQIFRLIIFKPALRAIYPALTSQFIMLLLTSSVVASVSATELTAIAQSLDAVAFRSFEIYFTVTVMYLAMSVLFARVFNRLYSYLFAYSLRR